MSEADQSPFCQTLYTKYKRLRMKIKLREGWQKKWKSMVLYQTPLGPPSLLSAPYGADKLKRKTRPWLKSCQGIYFDIFM